jgi:hypothetical protein
MTDRTPNFFTDRSRIIDYQRCPRRRFLGYHQDLTGIDSASTALPLTVGLAVHVGLGALLLDKSEDKAVVDAIRDLSQYRDQMALDLAESLARQSAVETLDFNAQLEAQAAALGMDVSDPALKSIFHPASDGHDTFARLLWQEQSALVEGLVRAYARRRLPVLLAEFDILEVEREGRWLLSEIDPSDALPSGALVHFMSRPDALMRSRADGQLYLLSFKTKASWDVRAAKDAETDLQGLSEGIEIEKRLGERIMGIRYEYMLKGYRSEDKALSLKVGFTAYAQRSPLTRVYRSTKNSDLNVAWDFLKEDGSMSKLAWQNWKGVSLADVGMSPKEWIDLLDDSVETMSAFDPTVGMEPRPLGWKSRAQTTGYLPAHPLDELFVAPITVYRHDDDLRDMLEQIEAEEARVAESVAVVGMCQTEEARRTALNVLFPQHRDACHYPSECRFLKICYGGEDIRRDPLGSGQYRRRVPNHPEENYPRWEVCQNSP